MASPSPAADDNPFATRYVQPGARPFLFAPGETLAGTFDRLARHGYRGQIVGPHGSGKSTLLRALTGALAAEEIVVVDCRLALGRRRLPADFPPSTAWTPATVLAIDGYEQLAGWRRWRLERAVRSAGAGLVITTHRDLGLPTIYQTTPRLETVARLVAQLLEGFPPLVAESDVAAAFARQRGDIRETLFTLYDLYEQRRPRPA